jgi:hypothetical protein
MPRRPERLVVDGVALDTDRDAAGSGVTFCFTERTGGVSSQPFASLNLGTKGGDDPACVAENRRRVMAALGAPDLLEGLVVPNQVHGDEVCVIDGPQVPAAALERGCDAVVCTVPERAVMLLFADCVPVVLVAPGAFAVAHSGWRGTLAGIAGTTARALAQAAGCTAAQVCAYVGPHIGAQAYEVSSELAATFAAAFGPGALASKRHLDLGACVRSSLEGAGVPPDQVVDADLCTASLTDRFFSHRAEMGRTGRHAAVAFMRG